MNYFKTMLISEYGLCEIHVRSSYRQFLKFINLSQTVYQLVSGWGLFVTVGGPFREVYKHYKTMIGNFDHTQKLSIVNQK